MPPNSVVDCRKNPNAQERDMNASSDRANYVVNTGAYFRARTLQGTGAESGNRAVRPTIALFGHFGAGNLGNEGTLMAMLENLQRLLPDADVCCICSLPDVVATDYGIATIPMVSSGAVRWKPRNGFLRALKKLLLGIPNEISRWIEAHRALRDTDLLIVVGTGLLTNAFSLFGWGPYSIFKWSLLARMRGCRVLFVSVGAGPVNRFSGRLLLKTALSLATFRSYRDQATRRYLAGIGFDHREDHVFPDLAFSLSAELPRGGSHSADRRVVGLGIMEFGGMYGIYPVSAGEYANYTSTLADFARWLLARGYDLQLLIGAQTDVPALEKFKAALSLTLTPREFARISGEPATSARHLVEQLAKTDLMVGTRFHNVLLALFLSKPSIAIAFHHKCSGLMEEMGVSEYCEDIHELTLEKLITKFCMLESKAAEITTHLAEKVLQNRAALDVQYRIICQTLGYSAVTN
jgi:polysaccharide pyruvyl transferase WcaK-like protein